MTQTSAQWALEVKATLDASGMSKGATDAETSVKGLETQVESSTDSINQSLRSMDDGVSSSLGTGGTLDRSASEAESSLGRVKEQVGEELPGAFLDMQDGAASAASGLAMAFSSAGPAGIALAGALALFAALKTKSDAAAQAMRDSINSALSEIEVKAKQSNKAIIASYEKTLTFRKTIEALGGGDATKGFGILADHADALGVSVADIVALINGQWTKGALRLRDQLRQAQDAVAKQRQDAEGIATRVLPSLNDEYQFLVDQISKQNEIQKRTVANLKQERDYARETAEAHKAGAGWLSAQEARLQGINNKLAAQQKFYGGLPQ